MTATKKTSRRRGRPRRFDPEAAVAQAQRLFHERGYDAVSVADMTAALDIGAPSLYAAFGNKADLFRNALKHYGQTGALPLADLLPQDRPVADCLGDVLIEAARRYTADASARGCMVLEGTRSNDADAREASKSYHADAQEAIRRFIAFRHPAMADDLADFMSVTMAGMSSAACNGYDQRRLAKVAKLAGNAIALALANQSRAIPLGP